MRHLLLAVLVLLGATVVPGAHADTAQDQTLAASLMAAGRIAEAEAIVARLRAIEPPDLQTLFLSGMLHIEAERYARAADEFRLMLTRDPKLLRPRLELARALYLNHDYEAARYHFEQVLASPLPDAVRKNVLNYIAVIRTRLPSFGFSVDIVSDTNPRQATSSKTVEIAGQPFVLSQNSRAEEKWGLQFTGQAKIPLPADPDWYASGYVENYDYPARDLDQTYLQLTGGRHFQWGAHEIDAELGGHYGAYQGTDLYRGMVGRVGYSTRLRPNLWANVVLDAREFTYKNFRPLDGWQYAQSVELRWAISPDKSLVPNVFFIHRDARDPASLFDAVGIGLRYGQEWSGGWLTRLTAQYSKFDYGGRDAFFGVVRDDEEWRGELSVANRQFAFRGFVPRLIVGYVDHRSNINLYAFERFYVRVGVLKDF